MPITSVCCALVLLALPSFGQVQASSGNIDGTVRDPSGIPIAGVEVSVINVETRHRRTVVTDDRGTYAFLMLPPGRYDLEWTSAGFGGRSLRGVRLRIGQSLELDAGLFFLPREELVVESRDPFIDTVRTQQEFTITEGEIRHLPTNGRAYLDFSLLSPGVSDGEALVNFKLPQTPTSGLSFSGQSPRSNSVTIDGVDNNDPSSGAVRATLPQSAVREFQINRSSYAAEFGRASGGVVNIVSRSGTNRLAGELFAFMRHERLDARNVFAFGPGGEDIDPPLSRVQAGFNLGGPIVPERSFFFVGWEGLRQRESSFSTLLENRSVFEPTDSQKELIGAFAGAADADLRASGLRIRHVLTTSEASYPETLRLLESDSGVFPFHNDDHRVFARLDQQDDRRQRFLRVSHADVDVRGDSSGGLAGYSRGTDSAVRDLAFVYGDSRFLSSRRVNDFRFQFAMRTFEALPIDPLGPEIDIKGTALLGRNYFLPSVHGQRRIQIVDNLTLAGPRHELKMGGEASRVGFASRVEVFFGGRFLFGESIPASRILGDLEGELVRMGRSDLIPNLAEPITPLQAYNAGEPLAYQQGFGNAVSRLSQTVLSGFVQDRFRLAPRLTLSMGVRYETELQPGPIPRDWNNVGPRLGLAYSPRSATVIRAGYGIFFAPVYQAIAFIGRVLDGESVSQVFLSPTGPGPGPAELWRRLKEADVIGRRSVTAEDLAGLGIEPGRTARVIFGTADDLVNPYSQHASFGIETVWSPSLKLETGYQMHRGVKLLRSRNRNLRIVGRDVDSPVFGPVNPDLVQDNRVEATGNSTHHGMTVSLEWRISGVGQMRTSYTVSKTIDDTTDFLTDLQPANQLDLAAERALSAFDQRHSLVVTGVFEADSSRAPGGPAILDGWRISPVLKLASGRPFNLLLGYDANHDQNPNTDRPPFAGRNTGRGPGFVSLDVRVTRSLEWSEEIGDLEIMVEAFNLLNRVNYRGVNNVVGRAPLRRFDLAGDVSAGPGSPLGFTSAFAPRQLQLGLRLLF